MLAIGRSLQVFGIVLVGWAVGCHPAAPTAADTGARQVARSFFEALGQRDWGRAYSALGAESRARTSLEQFTRLAQDYCRSYGLEPGGIHVGPCEEHGPEALAHVILTGKGSARHRRHKDAVVLRRDGAVWYVVLPSGFGRVRKP